MYVHTFSITAWGRSMKYILLMCCLIHSLHLTSSQEGNSSFQGFLLYILTNSANDDANFLLSAITNSNRLYLNSASLPELSYFFSKAETIKKAWKRNWCHYIMFLINLILRFYCLSGVTCPNGMPLQNKVRFCKNAKKQAFKQ